MDEVQTQLIIHVLIFSNENCNISQDSVSTFKTFILTHKAIFEFTNVYHSQYHTCFMKIYVLTSTLDLIQNKSTYLQAGFVILSMYFNMALLSQTNLDIKHDWGKGALWTM